MVWFIAFAWKRRNRFNIQNIYQPCTVASPFQLRISLAFSVHATGFVGLLLSCQNDKSTLCKQTFFYLDHHLHHTWNYSAGSVWEMGSKSTEKHEITEMPFFPPFHSSLASANYLCTSYTLYVLDVSPTVTAHACSQLLALFCFSPSALLPALFCPSKFLGDFISPISNRIGTQFAMLHVTLLENSTVDIETS